MKIKKVNGLLISSIFFMVLFFLNNNLIASAETYAVNLEYSINNYSWIGNFNEGFLIVAKNGKYGLINAIGREVTPIKYDWINFFKDGVATVKVGEKWGIIDKTGMEIVPVMYDYISDFNEGVALIRIGDRERGKWGVIKNTGEVITPVIKYDHISNYFEGLMGVNIFNEGVAPVEINGEYGVIDKTGREIVPLKYDKINNFKDGVATVKVREKWGVIDKTGREIVPIMYDYITDFNDGVAIVALEGKSGVIDKTGKEIIPLKYDSISEFSEGLATATKAGSERKEVVIINKLGREIATVTYDYISSFKEGLSKVGVGEWNTAKYGVIDSTGKEIVPLKYDDIGDFVGGLARVRVGKYEEAKFGVIDRTGREIVPTKYSFVGDFNDGIATVGMNGKCGAIDRMGNEVVPLKYDSISDFVEGFAVVRKGGIIDAKYGIIDKTGKEIISIEYDYIYYIGNGEFFVALGNECGIFDTKRMDKIVKVKSVKLNENSKTLSLGQTFQLEAEIKPSNATNKDIIWSTSNSKVAIVDKNGKVIASGIGTATIKAKTVNGGYEDTCIVQVLEPIKVKGISLNEVNKTIEKGRVFKLVASINPSNANNKNLIWISSNPLIADVDTQGRVKAEGIGTATITVQTVDGGYTAKCKVTVVSESNNVNFTNSIKKYDSIENFYDGLATVYINKDEKRICGVINEKGKEIVPLGKYDYVSEFYQGLAVVRKGEWENGKYGVIDKTGKEIVPVKYDKMWYYTEGLKLSRIRVFEEGVAPVKIGDKYGVIDKTGKEIVPLKYDWISNFYDGVAVMMIEDSETKKMRQMENNEKGVAVLREVKGKWGVIDKTGKEIVPLKYDTIGSFSQGLAVVSMGGKYGAIDKTGKEVIPIEYDAMYFTKQGLIKKIGSKWILNDKMLELDVDSVYDFNSGVAQAYKDEEGTGIIDENGKEIVPFGKYDYITDFEDGLAIVMSQFGGNRDCGIINNKGEEIVPLGKYNFINDFKEGLAIVIKGEFPKRKYGIIDKTGKEIVPLIYDYIGDFKEGLAIVNKEGKCGIIDKAGKLIVPLEYDYIYELGEGLFTVKKEDAIGIIDNTGKEIVPLGKYDEILGIYDGLIVMKIWFGGIGLIDKTGKEIVPVKYDNIAYIGDGKFFVVVEDKCGILDTKQLKQAISVTSVKLNESNKVLNLGQTLQLLATINPSNATNKNVIWSSSNPKVATVDKNGKVIAVGEGTTTIIVKTVDGEKTAQCKVTVNQIKTIKTTGVKLDKTTITLKKNGKAKLTATILPNNATNKKVIWISSNTKVIKVDANGNITAVGKGTATITVKTVDGGKIVTCKVIVK